MFVRKPAKPGLELQPILSPKSNKIKYQQLPPEIKTICALFDLNFDFSKELVSYWEKVEMGMSCIFQAVGTVTAPTHLYNGNQGCKPLLPFGSV